MHNLLKAEQARQVDEKCELEKELSELRPMRVTCEDLRRQLAQKETEAESLVEAARTANEEATKRADGASLLAKELAEREEGLAELRSALQIKQAENNRLQEEHAQVLCLSASFVLFKFPFPSLALFRANVSKLYYYGEYVLVWYL